MGRNGHNRVYVIELERAAGPRRDPRIPWVYVGSSARSPEDRFEQHKRGYKSARVVKRHWRRLRPDLYEDLEPIRGKRAAVAAEQERARELAAAGFIAHCDGTSYGKDTRAADWQEWDRERLDPVLGHLDDAIAELAACSFAPLDPEPCAQLLHGAHGFWVPDYIDQDDPPPSYGLFPHVRLDVLEERARELAPEPAVAPR
ncbi:MAG TPA: hypothetical protein VKA36_05080 [Solirubrobacterales bacterium]|nr:hypothetical protein [Solirubrobacterales bacterium]